MDGQFIKDNFERISLIILNKKVNSNAKLAAVSKKQSIDKIKFLYSLGQKLFAENYVQELLEKQNELSNLNIQWHLIGPLQTNKVGKIVGKVDLIHSVDKLTLAQKISQIAQDYNLTQKILLQINLANEESKSGFSLQNFNTEFQQILKLPNLEISGFMIMPPFSEDPESSRKYFKQARMLLEKYQKQCPSLVELSMGTTQDFEVALEEGASIIRIGEALLGPRSFT